LAFIVPSKFAKIFHKQFTLLLFKAIYSNNEENDEEYRPKELEEFQYSSEDEKYNKKRYVMRFLKCINVRV